MEGQIEFGPAGRAAGEQPGCRWPSMRWPKDTFGIGIPAGISPDRSGVRIERGNRVDQTGELPRESSFRRKSEHVPVRTGGRVETGSFGLRAGGRRRMLWFGLGNLAHLTADTRRKMVGPISEIPGLISCTPSEHRCGHIAAACIPCACRRATANAGRKAAAAQKTRKRR